MRCGAPTSTVRSPCARRVRTGQIAVNGFGPGGAPFGGFKQSGFGRESGGIGGIRQYMEPKAIGMPRMTARAGPCEPFVNGSSHAKLLGMVLAIARPKLEGNIAVGEDRQIGFAEFGDPQGRAVFWLHGTPGARRQIPTEARVYAEQHNIRLIGIDRPGIGSSTPHQYDNVVAFADDLRTIADTLGIDKMAVIGLSGGGPYTLACAAALPDRVVAVGVLGGVAPTRGPDAISGGAMNLGLRVAPLLRLGGPTRCGSARAC